MTVAILVLIASGISIGGDVRTLRSGHADGWLVLWLIFDVATIILAIVLLRADRKRAIDEAILKWVTDSPDKGYPGQK